MNFLKTIPLKWKGQLHDVRLVNFSVPLEEVQGLVPLQIRIRDFEGRAMISMVDVLLKNMRLSGMPEFCSFSYRHLAFRLLVDDGDQNHGISKGIFFIKSFTDRSLMALGGSLFTHYRLGRALIYERNQMVTVDQGAKQIRYCLGGPGKDQLDLKNVIGQLDRAYSVNGNVLFVTQIMREKWPLVPYSCTEFYTNFFRDTRLEGVFKVPEVIYYTWLPPERLEL